MVFHRLLRVGAIIGLALSSGCSSKTFSAHAYPGEPLPAAQVAQVEVNSNVRLVSVDGNRVDALPVDLDLSSNSGAKRTLNLLPGTHRAIAGVASRYDRRGSVGFGLGVGGGIGHHGGIGTGVGVGSGGDGRIVQGSDFNDEIEFDVAAGKTYTLFETERAGSGVEKTRLVLRNASDKKSSELQRLIERKTFDDPYGTRAPTTQP